IGLERQELGIRLRRDRAALLPIEVDRVLRRRRGNIEAPRAATRGLAARPREEPLTEAAMAIVPAHVQEFELQLTAARADESAFEKRRADQARAIEQAVRDAAVVVTIEEHRRVFLRLARRPTLHVEVHQPERELPVLEHVSRLDQLAAIDRP